MASDILLESGTNEMEVLVFKCAGGTYGINVSKVNEIIMSSDVTPIPCSHPSVMGVVMPREKLLNVIDLKNCLIGEQSTEEEKKSYFIITHFNNIDTAFLVGKLIGIKRISWNDIIKPNSTICDENGVITGIINIDKELVSILDFEKIMVDINPDNGLTVKDIEKISTEKVAETEKKNITVLLAEDSKMLNKMITESIEKAGYKVIHTADGVEAYETLEAMVKGGTIYYGVQCVVTDIEIPRMDGLALCKKIKENESMNKLPVIMFSSLIDENMRRKCESVGANGCMSKPEVGKLVSKIEELVAGRDK